MQHVVPNNVARCCVEMLRVFDEALSGTSMRVHVIVGADPGFFLVGRGAPLFLAKYQLYLKVIVHLNGEGGRGECVCVCAPLHPPPRSTPE